MVHTLPLADHQHAVIEHFSLGYWIAGLAYVVAVVGSVVGLSCARQSAFVPDGARRQRWLLMAAVSIGGVAVWLMHFIAMLGMRVPGTIARYDLGWTAFSAVLSIGATYLALLIVGRTVRWSRLVPAGFLMGLAVATMHYTGMMAVGIQGSMSYDPLLVAASVAIAVVASVVALWFTLVLEAKSTRFVGGLIAGVAVVGMHYTGMAAMTADVDPTAAVPTGFEVFTFLFPILIAGMLALAVPITALMLAPERTDADTPLDDLDTDELDAVVAETPEQRPPAVTV